MAFGPDKKIAPRDYEPGSPETPSRSFFGKTMRIEGEITSDEDLTIEGKIKGQLEVSKTLTIGKAGYVDGKIKASVVQIKGEAEGYLEASQKLEISSEGKYSGNIKSNTIKVAEGAKIKGTINLGTEIPSPTTPQEEKVEKDPGTTKTIETADAVEPTPTAETIGIGFTDTVESKETIEEAAELKESTDTPGSREQQQEQEQKETAPTGKKTSFSRKAKKY